MRGVLPLLLTLFPLAFGVCASGLQPTGCPADHPPDFSACSSNENTDNGDRRLMSNSLSAVVSTIPTSGEDILGAGVVEHGEEKMESKASSRARNCLVANRIDCRLMLARPLPN